MRHYEVRGLHEVLRLMGLVCWHSCAKSLLDPAYRTFVSLLGFGSVSMRISNNSLLLVTREEQSSSFGPKPYIGV